MKRALELVCVVLLVAACSEAAIADNEQLDTRHEWTELPMTGFIAGRAATIVDVDAGNAVFSLDGRSLGPIGTPIPQYAIWTDENGSHHPVVLVQAERAPGGLEIVGLLLKDGSTAAATRPEIRLLGTEMPRP